jgi:hypothetical protein
MKRPPESLSSWRRPSCRRRTGGDLHDRGAEIDLLGLPGQPGQDADAVGAVGLGHPDGFETGLLGSEDCLQCFVSCGTDPPITEVQTEQ